MDEIREEIVSLKGSELADLRRQEGYEPVIGDGSLEAKVMFVGEAPGEKEAKTGKPFVGRAGQILDELLFSVDIRREDVYITNIVKDRPPKNRDPKPEEIALYAPFLDKQIEIIKPKVIATLGRFSTEYVMRRYGLEGEVTEISKLHGKPLVSPSGFVILPLFHPAAAIYNQSLKPALLEDFKILKTLI